MIAEGPEADAGWPDHVRLRPRPLGLTIAPNGDILTANGGNGNIVETTPFGFQLPPVDTGAGAGGLFGLAVAPNNRSLYFVNDLENTLELLH